MMFYFTSKKDKELVTRNIDYRDNVIPASNSIMAKNLFKLSHYYGNTNYYKTATSMLNNIKPEIATYVSGFSNWLDLMLNYTNPFYEVAIVGEKAMEKTKELNKYYLPNILTATSKIPDNSPLLKGRFLEGKTYIYVCVNNSCKLPVGTINEAIELLND